MVEEKTDDLYGDLSEGIDNTVVESYGKVLEEGEIDVGHEEELACDELDATPPEAKPEVDEKEDIVLFHEERDVLDLHVTEAELKAHDLDKSEVLAPLPEKSKWEVRGTNYLSTEVIYPLLLYRSYTSISGTNYTGKCQNCV